jgi:transposase-like protein
MPRTYTDEERIDALALAEAHGGSVRYAAGELGMPVSTLQTMQESASPRARDHVQNASADYAAGWGEVVRRATRIISAQLARYEAMDLTPSQTRDVAVIAGIASDKHLDYRDGRKGAVTLDQSQHLTLPPGTSLDDVRALRDSLRATQRVDAPDAGRAVPNADASVIVDSE